MKHNRFGILFFVCLGIIFFNNSTLFSSLTPAVPALSRPDEVLLVPESVQEPAQATGSSKGAVSIDDIEKGIQTAIFFKEMAVLADVPLPEQIVALFDTLVVNGLEVNRGKLVSHITGTVFIDGEATSAVAVVDNQNVKKAALRFAVPSSWKIGQKIPELKGLDQLDLQKVYFVISSFDYQDEEFNVPINKGFNMIARIPNTGMLQSMTKVKSLNDAKEQVVNEFILAGTIAKQIVGSRFLAHLPRSFKFSNSVYSKGLDFQVVLAQSAPGVVVPSFSVIGTLHVVLPADPQQQNKKNNERLFNIEFMLDPTKAALKGFMDGAWEQPFGIKGLVVRDVGIEGIINFAAAAASGGLLAISGLGVRGVVDVGSKHIELASQGEVGATGNMSLVGLLQGGLYTYDLIDFMVTMASKVSKQDKQKKDQMIAAISNKVPNIGFDNVSVYIVPKDISLAGKTYERGMSMDASVKLFGTQGSIAMKVSADGVEGRGSLAPAKMGKLTITSAGDPAQGAQIALKLAANNSALYVDGKATLDLFGGLSQKTKIDLVPSGLKFAMEQRLFGLYEANLVIEAQGPINLQMPSVYVKASMKQSFLNIFADAIKNTARVVKQGVSKASADISTGADKERQITTEKIDALEAKIKAKRAECDNAPLLKQTYICPKVGAELTPMGIELGALKTYRDGLLKAGVPLAQAVTENVGGAATASFLNALAQGASSAFNIKRISFEGSTEDFSSGVMPNVTIEGAVLGRRFCLLNMQLNLSTPETFAQSATYILDQLLGALTSSKGADQCAASGG